MHVRRGEHITTLHGLKNEQELSFTIPAALIEDEISDTPGEMLLKRGIIPDMNEGKF